SQPEKRPRPRGQDGRPQGRFYTTKTRSGHPEAVARGCPDERVRSEFHDDLGDFFIQIEWSDVTVNETIEALQTIEADEHGRLLAPIA
ncbi:hypothetical protein, partial [Bradyrhizobium sp. SZCCHNS1049]|uniref:hypothetical protein n=1 Tax=Bradyrhizobium sp. SZCCHNS1049 TaxID=3057299 RepID=UPI0029165627